MRFQVEKVLQMSMFDRQKATLKMKEIDANELITGVVNTFALKVERYNGKITSNLEATDPVIFADEMHLKFFCRIGIQKLHTGFCYRVSFWNKN